MKTSVVHHSRNIYDQARFFGAIGSYWEMITSLMAILLSVFNNCMTIVAARGGATEP